MRRWETIGVLILCLALAGSIACSPFGGGEEGVSQQLVEVVRGDLIVSVSGSGNIEVSKEANVAFDVGGRIDKIYVDDGDSVNEGDVLAKLETNALELALTQAKVTLTTQQVAVTQAEVALRTAEYNLDQARDLYTWPEIEVAQADVNNAKAFVDYVLERNLPEATVEYARARLVAAEAKLNAMIHTYDTEEVAIKKVEVELAEQSLQLSRLSLRQVQQSLQQAQKNLNEATLIAPFDGVVANVYAKEGDVIPSPTMAPR
ncbi:MAG: HlyD family secretion protein, partial [Dehalococcoidales bacterium]